MVQYWYGPLYNEQFHLYPIQVMQYPSVRKVLAPKSQHALRIPVSSKLRSGFFNFFAF